MSFDSGYDDADIIVFGSPFDGTASFRPGSRFAPSVMRSEFYGLETYSPYFDMDLEDVKVFDAGDLELPFGNAERALRDIYQCTLQIVKDRKIPLMIGGEHLVSLGAFKAISDEYDDICLIHFDAHADLRDDYLGEKLSHATVVRRIWDIVGDGRIYQFGVRSGQRQEFSWACQHTFMHKYTVEGIDVVASKIGDGPVYLSIDLDIFDPSVFPGTGTPEPGGIMFNDMLIALKNLSSLNIVGADIVELAPHYDQTGVSTAVACKVLRELIFCIKKHI